MIDLISDTITRPTAAMRAAMAAAPVGDDVFDEDPTAHALQDYAASLFGHEAALFMPSGVMSNQIAIKAHTQPMDELICADMAHVYRYENGGYAFHSQIAIHPIRCDRGLLSAADVDAAIKPAADWLPRSRLVVLENTVNAAGGAVQRLTQAQAVADLCRQRDLRLHLDGARLFNALQVTGDSPSAWGQLVDSLSICLSKGLGAPVGSLLIGSRAFIASARRLRKGFGGGMRQIGGLAAAGLFALQHHVERLSEDHAHARLLAAALGECRSVARIAPVETNIVIFDLQTPLTAADVLERLRSEGVRGAAFGPATIRLVTHLDVSSADIERACETLRRVLDQPGG
jgi:threonine aldolase